jgi:hypothetical protein
MLSSQPAGTARTPGARLAVLQRSGTSPTAADGPTTHMMIPPVTAS